MRSSFGCLLIWLAGLSVGRAAPDLVVSIRPIHSLVSSLTKGVVQPQLLMDGVRSPHLYRLKPSDIQRLQVADGVIWIGPSMESGLIKPLQSVAVGHVLSLLADARLVRWQTRAGGRYDASGGLHGSEAAEFDPHVWLDVRNARLMVDVLREYLQRLDSAHAIQYGHNAEVLQRQLDKLDMRLRQQLSVVRGVGFLWGHDGFQYLERAYGLNALGSVSVHAEHLPGVQRLLELQQLVEAEKVCCILVEQGSSDPVVESLVLDKSLVLCRPDPLGLGLRPGESLYWELMVNVGSVLTECLGRGLKKPRSLKGGVR